MSYTLVYSDRRGNEFTDRPCSSIADVNERIRDLHDAIDGVVILRIEHDHDGPRTWQIPTEPEGVEQVVGQHSGRAWTHSKDGFWDSPGCAARAWRQLLADEGRVTEVVETEVEAAARRLRELRAEGRNLLLHVDDVRTVLDHVLSGGTLPAVK